MNIKQLLSHIDSFAPFSTAEEWDNPGLMTGSYSCEVRKIAVCLDAVSEAVIEAEKNNCNVIVCHHPLIFRPIKHVTDDSEQGRTIINAIKRNINIISAHTNWDKAQGGVNDTLAKLIGLNVIDSLGEYGIFGKMNESMNLHDFLEHVKTSWNLSHIDLYSQELPEKISRVSLCGGSGAEFWKQAKKFNSDIYLTADMKYHELSDANNDGLSIGLINHGEMERASLKEFAQKISQSGIETIIINVNALSEPLRI